MGIGSSSSHVTSTATRRTSATKRIVLASSISLVQKKSPLRGLVSLAGCSLHPESCRHSSFTTDPSILSDKVLSKLGGSSNSRWGSSRVSDEPKRNDSFGARDSNRELSPTRADETDN
ncbi:hypothetical protein VIGAN_09093200 [Vigna angularis var. angularis]|uniref:Uncharacterized protein n=1 Tax=Vigna angularis var. angularis TaxID=157739 RepID=A0A0S3SX91_PHAAN|nr:hypothetical protein VIGAN_09093200 [Vigna angularis var. angularis]